MLSGFKQFILRGNMLDLAIGVVIGASFNSVVNALVKDLITPLVTAIAGQPNFASLQFTIHHSTFMYGDFLNSVLTFVIDAAVIYFFVVMPFTKMVALIHKPTKESKEELPFKQCPECLSEIPKEAKRCKFCTALLTKEVHA